MIRRFSLLLLAALPLHAQEPPAAPAAPAAPAERPVLKALKVDPAEIPTEDPSAAPVEPARVSTPEPAKPIAAAPTAPAPVSPDGKPTGDDAVRLQIFLDQAMFGPGVIDGKTGRFTELAVQTWNEVHGHAPGDWAPVLQAARKAVPNPFAVAVVPDVVKDWLDPTLPQDRPGQSKRKRMSYRSVTEFMSERYHTSTEYLATINGGSKTKNLKARDSLIVPNVQPFAIEMITGKKYEAEPKLSTRHAVVDTKQNQIRVYERIPAAVVVTDEAAAGAVKVTRPTELPVATFPITPGQPKFIKYGLWDLKNCLELPYWRYDKSLLETGKRSSNALNIPPGPNSPVGILWAGLSKPGIGMHGTADPETIGRARSAGCIRLANWDAIRLPTLIRPGATVEIR